MNLGFSQALVPINIGPAILPGSSSESRTHSMAVKSLYMARAYKKLSKNQGEKGKKNP